MSGLGRNCRRPRRAPRWITIDEVWVDDDYCETIIVERPAKGSKIVDSTRRIRFGTSSTDDGELSYDEADREGVAEALRALAEVVLEDRQPDDELDPEEG